MGNQLAESNNGISEEAKQFANKDGKILVEMQNNLQRRSCAFAIQMARLELQALMQICCPGFRQVNLFKAYSRRWILMTCLGKKIMGRIVDSEVRVCKSSNKQMAAKSACVPLLVPEIATFGGNYMGLVSVADNSDFDASNENPSMLFWKKGRKIHEQGIGSDVLAFSKHQTCIAEEIHSSKVRGNNMLIKFSCWKNGKEWLADYLFKCGAENMMKVGLMCRGCNACAGENYVQSS